MNILRAISSLACTCALTSMINAPRCTILRFECLWEGREQSSVSGCYLEGSRWRRVARMRKWRNKTKGYKMWWGGGRFLWRLWRIVADNMNIGYYCIRSINLIYLVSHTYSIAYKHINSYARVCYPERQSSMLEGSNACGLTKEEEETYVSASQCVSPIPSILDNRDHFTRAQIRTLSFVFVSPTVCPTVKALKMERKKEATHVSVPHPASPALWDTHAVSLCFVFYFSTKLWGSFYFCSQLVTWLKPIEECVNWPVSSGLGRGGCSRTRHIYSIVPNPTGSDA